MFIFVYFYCEVLYTGSAFLGISVNLLFIIFLWVHINLSLEICAVMKCLDKFITYLDTSWEISLLKIFRFPCLDLFKLL